MLRKLNNNGKPAERVTPLKCTTNPRVTTISGQPGVGFDVEEVDGEGEARALLSMLRHHPGGEKKALDILGDLYADADPFLFGRIILLIKNALKAGL